MKIQLINYTGTDDFKYNVDKISRFSEPKSLDFFDINIIDLRDNRIWINYKLSEYYNEVEIQKDFTTVSRMISQTKSSNIVILMPSNVVFKTYYTSHNKAHNKKEPLKNITMSVEHILRDIVPLSKNSLMFEKNESQLEDQLKVESDFCFETLIEGSKVLIKSNTSNKNVAYSFKNTVVTTLDIKNKKELNAFFVKTHLIEVVSENKPTWMKDVFMFNDEHQIQVINSAEQEIQEQNRKIETANAILAQNDRYKSILYSQSGELVEVVTEMLEKMLSINLSEFKDEFDSDLEFLLNEVPFVVEIKGVNSNVNKTHLTQLESHAATYSEEKAVDFDSIKKLLIINPQRKTAVTERKPVHPDQINLAENRYGILIIETNELLKLFEKYTNKEVTTDYCIDLLNNIGILKESELSGMSFDI